MPIWIPGGTYPPKKYLCAPPPPGLKEGRNRYIIMSAHYFDVIRFSSYIVFTAGLVCVCVCVYVFFFTQKTKKEEKNVHWRGVDPVSTAPTCRSSQRQEKI